MDNGMQVVHIDTHRDAPDTWSLHMNVNEMIKLLLTMPADCPIVIRTAQGVTDHWQLVWNDNHESGNCAMIEVFE